MKDQTKERDWLVHRMLNGTPENALDAEKKLRELGYDITLTGKSRLQTLAWKILRYFSK